MRGCVIDCFDVRAFVCLCSAILNKYGNNHLPRFLKRNLEMWWWGGAEGINPFQYIFFLFLRDGGFLAVTDMC